MSEDIKNYIEEKKLIRGMEYAKCSPKQIKNISRYFANCFESLQSYFETFSISGMEGDSPYRFFCGVVNKFSVSDIKIENCDFKKQFDNNQFYVKLLKTENDDLFTIVPKGFVNSLLKKSKDDEVSDVTNCIADDFVFKKILSVAFDSLNVAKTEVSLEDSLSELKNKFAQSDFNNKIVFELRVETKDCNSNENVYSFYFILDVETGLKLIWEDGLTDEIRSSEYYLYQNSFCLLGKANISEEQSCKIKPGVKIHFKNIVGHNMDIVINDKIAATGSILDVADKKIKIENVVELEKQKCIFDNNNFLILYSMDELEYKDVSEWENITFEHSSNYYYPVVYRNNIIAQCRIVGDVDNLTVEISKVLKEPVAFRE